jgi:hypothetical protein
MELDMITSTYNPYKVKKRIVVKFLLIPFKDKGKYHFFKKVLMVQFLLPMPIMWSYDWFDSHIATIEDIINI